MHEDMGTDTSEVVHDIDEVEIHLVHVQQELRDLEGGEVAFNRRLRRSESGMATLHGIIAGAGGMLVVMFAVQYIYNSKKQTKRQAVVNIRAHNPFGDEEARELVAYNQVQ